MKLGQNVSASGVGMPPSRYQCRPPGGSASGPRGCEPAQAALGVERVEQGIEVVLVGAPAVEEDERSGRLALGRPLEGVDGHLRGLGSGVSRGSICSRRCSKSGGSESRSPRCSASSSVAKPGPERRELEQDPVRLPEVDRLEVEAVDHRRRAVARLGDALLPGVVILDRRRPGDVVDGAGAGDAAALGRGVVGVPAAASLAARLPRVVAVRAEAERVLEQRGAAVGVDRVGADAVEALQGVLLRDLRAPRHQRLVRRLDDAELVPDALRVLEAEAVAGAHHVRRLARQALLPEVERGGGTDPPDDRVHHPRAGPAAGGARVLEEGDVGAGAALLVGIEEVVDGGVVLVDRLLDEAEPQHPRVEVDVARRIPGDQRHVVDTFEQHRCIVQAARRLVRR